MPLTLQVIAPAVAGGLLIGLGIALMLLGAGRVAGISGIFHRALAGPRSAAGGFFLAGLLGSALLAALFAGFDPGSTLEQPHWPKLLLAGLLVGVGTELGNGCTSGHGICGIGNGSGRSLVATLVFMAVAALVVALGFGGLQ